MLLSGHFPLSLLSEYRIDSQWMFVLGGICLVASLAFMARKQERWALWILLAGVLGLRLFAATLDPFLNDWDERFHALVASNMVDRPLEPRLHANPVVSYPGQEDYWVNSTVWLHKQPLFLWQIAIFFKVFGATVFALRLPSIIMSVLTAWLLFRIGKRLVNSRTGLLAAFFFGVSWMPIELTSGRLGMEHNDIAFLFYVTASVWAWVAYQTTGKTKWIWLVGLFSGAAILVKWLVGLLVYAVWGLCLLTSRRHRARLSKWMAMGKALLTTFLVAGPWQLYTWWRHPEIASREMDYNSQHLWIAIEGHSGPWHYHLDRLTDLYGPWAWGWVPLGLIALGLAIRKSSLRWGILALPLVVYLFFSLVQTKLPAYPLVAASVLFVALATLADRAWTWIESRSPVLAYGFALGVLVLGWFHLRFDQTTKWHSHTAPEGHVITKLANQIVLEQWATTLPENAVIFNVAEHRKVEVMFFTKRPAYPFLPTPDQVNELNESGFQVFVAGTANELPGVTMLSDSLGI